MTKRGSYALAVAFAVTAAAACGRGDQTARDTTAQPPAATQPTASAAHGAASDAAITTTIQARYYTDETIRGGDIDVSTSSGVVTLTGSVENEQAKSRAVEIARDAEGVTDVNDQLQVAGDTASSDQPAPSVAQNDQDRADAGERPGRSPAWITTKIQAQYFVNPDIKPWNIDVTTRSNGTVTLSGEVDDANDRQKALEIARTTEGVTQVQDRLRVRGETESEAVATTGPGAAETRDEAPADDPGARGESMLEPLGDAWLTSKIQSKYFLDDEVKGSNIDVTTADGNVTLSGSVASEAQRRQAVAVARNTDGVKNVQDRLKLDASLERDLEPGDWNVRGVQNPFGDEWLKTKIESKFFMDSTVKTQDIDVEARAGVVTLTGQARSEEAKRAAVQIAEGTAGVRQVQDRITIGGRQ